MHDEIIREVSAIIGNAPNEDAFPKFSDAGYAPYRISRKNFYPIKEDFTGKKIAFIDGGNADILKSASFSLGRLRTSYAVFSGSKKAASGRLDEMYLANAVSEEGEIHYRMSFFGGERRISLDGISFSSLDRSIMGGMSRADIGSISNAARRFAELMTAKFVADSSMVDIIVLDGTLQATLTGETAYLDQLYESCMKNGIIIAALSKTSSLFTDSGNLLSAALDSISPPGSWLYHPVADIKSFSHRAEIFFAKLHPKSRHVFRFEIFRKQKDRAEDVMGALAHNCRDPVFIGYPYGLVEADHIARISRHETEQTKIMLLAKMKNRNIERYLSSQNAHEILDRVRF